MTGRVHGASVREILSQIQGVTAPTAETQRKRFGRAIQTPNTLVKGSGGKRGRTTGARQQRINVRERGERTRSRTMPRGHGGQWKFQHWVQSLADVNSALAVARREAN